MDSGCRLCNSNLMLISIFDIPLQDSEHIKKCIELATGLSIQNDDEIGKFVCKHCCDIAILCHKYRRNAQMNAVRIRDELLKIKSSLSSTTYRKPGQKSMRNIIAAAPSTPYRKPGPKSMRDRIADTPSIPPSTYRKPGPKSMRDRIEDSPPTTCRKPGPKSMRDRVEETEPTTYRKSMREKIEETEPTTYRKPGSKSVRNRIEDSPPTTYRKPGPKSMRDRVEETESTAYRKPGPRFMRYRIEDTEPTTYRKPGSMRDRIADTPPTTNRKPGPKSMRDRIEDRPPTTCRKRGLKSMRDRIAVTPSTSNTNIPSTKYNITPSTSKILLQYPSLKIPKVLYTENIKPFVNLQDIGWKYNIDRDGHVNLCTSPKQYRITTMNTTKLHLKKLKPSQSSSNLSSSDVADGDLSDYHDHPGIMSDNSDTPLLARSLKAFNSPSKASEAESNLLIPVTYKDEFMCNVCNKMLKSSFKLELHLQKYHEVADEQNNDDSSDGSSIMNYSSTKSESTGLKSQLKTRKTIKEEDDDAGSVASSSNAVDPPAKRRKLLNQLVLRLTRIEEDNFIRQNYPAVFNEPTLSISENITREDISVSNDNAESVAELSDTEEVAGIRSTWIPDLRPHEEAKVADCFLSFLRTRIREKPFHVKPKVVDCKDAEVQATIPLDKQFKLDSMGPNEMDVLLPELSLYNVPVSILKQSPLKDTTAFFIQYSPNDTVHKPIDWSKLPKIDLERHILRTSTPLSYVESDGGNLSTWSLPSLTSLKDLRRNED